jgi:hypothetical protein
MNFVKHGRTEDGNLRKANHIPAAGAEVAWPSDGGDRANFQPFSVVFVARGRDGQAAALVPGLTFIRNFIDSSENLESA